MNALATRLVLAGLLGCALPAAGAHRRTGRQRAGQPGNFDYYVLALSWSPEYCNGRPSDPQCTGQRHFGFVVHGLWPQFSNGTWPASCSNGPGLSNPSQMLDIMPSPALIQHEWTTHGTCSGLGADGYFALLRKAFETLHIPSRFVAPPQYILISPQQLKQAFEQSNPALHDDSLVVGCSGGKYLSQMEVCMSKRLQPIPCTSAKECTASQLRMPPVR